MTSCQILFVSSSEYECFQIELAKNYGIPEWREDIKKVMMKAGVEGKSVVFLFSDTQVGVGIGPSVRYLFIIEVKWYTPTFYQLSLTL